MKARTIHEPYAWAIFHGLKYYETLPRRTNVRGRVAIHAAKHLPASTVYYFLNEIAKDTIHSGIYTPEWLYMLPRGVVLGTVEIIGCVRVEQIRDNLTMLQRAFGDFSDGRYAAILANPILFARPIPATGQQGWWNFGGDDSAIA